jgi:hypothetical protein
MFVAIMTLVNLPVYFLLMTVLSCCFLFSFFERTSRQPQHTVRSSVRFRPRRREGEDVALRFASGDTK